MLSFLRRNKSKTPPETAPQQLPQPPLSDQEKKLRQQLAAVAQKGFNGRPHVTLDLHVMDLGIPSVAHLSFMHTGSQQDTEMHIRELEVDPQLQRRGIGSLLLARSIQYALGRNPNIETIATGPVHRDHIRLMEKVLGKENVELPEGATPTDEALIRGGVRAVIDRERIGSIHTEQMLHELAETGRVDLNLR